MTARCRVAVLTSGPRLEYGVQEFIRQLEAHAGIELAAVLWQTQDPSFRGVVADLWRRRRWLALPLLVQKYLGKALRVLVNPSKALELARTLRAVRARIHCFEDIHSRAALQVLRECRPRLSLVYGAPIIRKSLYDIAPLGSLGIHHGRVPEYRGKKTTFWEIYHGEPVAGVTIQQINDTLDAGDVVESGEVAIGITPPWLVWKRLERLGFRLYIKAILDVCSGQASRRRPQGRIQALCRDPSPADIAGFWLRYLRRLWRALWQRRAR